MLGISVEDLEDIGFYKLGHQKRLMLAIKKLKELMAKSSKRTKFGLSLEANDDTPVSMPDPMPPLHNPLYLNKLVPYLDSLALNDSNSSPQSLRSERHLSCHNPESYNSDDSFAPSHTPISHRKSYQPYSKYQDSSDDVLYTNIHQSSPKPFSTNSNIDHHKGYFKTLPPKSKPVAKVQANSRANKNEIKEDETNAKDKFVKKNLYSETNSFDDDQYDKYKYLDVKNLDVNKTSELKKYLDIKRSLDVLKSVEAQNTTNLNSKNVSNYTNYSADSKSNTEDVTYTNIPITKILQNTGHNQTPTGCKNGDNNLINGHNDMGLMTKSENFDSDLKYTERDTRARTR